METKVAFVGDVHLQEAPPRSRKDDYFDTVLTKLEWIIGSNDVIIVLGDFFSRKILSTLGYKNLIERLSKVLGSKKLYIIPGNHDIYNMNMGTLPRTGLGLLYSAGVVKPLESLSLFGVWINALELQSIPKIKKTYLKEAILVGHVFYQSTMDEEFSLVEEDIKGSGYKYVILGHDHEFYNPLLIGNTTLLRPGSLARNTSHSYNLERVVGYYQFIIGSEGVKKLEYMEIPVPPAVDVFLNGCFEKKTKLNSYVFLDNVQTLVKSMVGATNFSETSIKKVLIEAGSPDFVLMYLNSLYERANLKFS